MRAAVLSRYGDVEGLELRDVPEPVLGPGKVKVRIAASSLNPLDLKLVSGALKEWFPLQLPAILGFDAAGEVVEVGPGVSGFRVGDQVLGQIRHGQAELALVTPEEIAKVPPGLSVVDAAALPVVGLTGTQLLEEAVGPAPGDLVLVTGALGAVGRYAVHAGRRRKVRIVAGVRRRQLQEAAALGVEQVVALDDPDAVAALPTLQGIADTVGGATVAALLPRLAPGGRLGSVVGEPPGAKERGIQVRAIQTHADPASLARLAQEVASGDVVVPITARFPLAHVREAFRAADHAGGKVLLTL
ncbi:MAG TPA: NADP-dependent oxidoreductase [Myxococcaceae bacterium]|nr:NADP-dependent oxidoreductase [Myxococcaceae bacterium]